MLPPNIVQQMCESTVLVESCITSSDGNFIKGIACGYDVFNKTFLLGEFGSCICFDTSRETVWTKSITARELEIVVSSFCGSNFVEENHKEFTNTNYEMITDRETEIKTYDTKAKYLYQQLASWVFKYQHYLGLNISEEFAKVACGKHVKVPFKVQ